MVETSTTTYHTSPMATPRNENLKPLSHLCRYEKWHRLWRRLWMSFHKAFVLHEVSSYMKPPFRLLLVAFWNLFKQIPPRLTNPHQDSPMNSIYPPSPYLPILPPQPIFNCYRLLSDSISLSLTWTHPQLFWRSPNSSKKSKRGFNSHQIYGRHLLGVGLRGYKQWRKCGLWGHQLGVGSWLLA